MHNETILQVHLLSLSGQWSGHIICSLNQVNIQWVCFFSINFSIFFQKVESKKRTENKQKGSMGSPIHIGRFSLIFFKLFLFCSQLILLYVKGTLSLFLVYSLGKKRMQLFDRETQLRTRNNTVSKSYCSTIHKCMVIKIQISVYISLHKLRVNTLKIHIRRYQFVLSHHVYLQS